MKAIFLATLSLVVVAGIASAQPSPVVDLAWDGCYGSASAVQNKDYGAAGQYNLFCSATGVTPVSPELWFGHTVSISVGGAPGGAFPDAWRFDDASDGNPEGCPATNFMIVSWFDVGVAGCGGLRNGAEVPVTAYLYDDVARKALLYSSTGYPTGRNPSAATRYLLWRWTFDIDNTVCGGALDPMCLHITSSEFAVGPDPNQTHLVLGTNGSSGGFVGWNDAQNTLHCPDATPTQTSTWGKVKGLYR